MSKRIDVYDSTNNEYKPLSGDSSGKLNIGNLPSTQTVDGEIIIRDKIRDYRKNDQCWIHSTDGYVNAETGGFNYNVLSIYNTSDDKYTYVYDINTEVSHPTNSSTTGALHIFVNQLSGGTPTGGTTQEPVSLSGASFTSSYNDLRVGEKDATSPNMIEGTTTKKMIRHKRNLNDSSSAENSVVIISETFHPEYLELPPGVGITINIKSNSGDVDVNYSANIKFFESDTRV